MKKKDSANTRGNRRVMLVGASKHFVWSRVASSHPSHRLKMQEVSPQAVTKQGRDLEISISQLKRDTALHIAPSSLWIPVVCSGKGTTKLKIEIIKTGALEHHLTHFVRQRGEREVPSLTLPFTVAHTKAHVSLQTSPHDCCHGTMA